VPSQDTKPNSLGYGAISGWSNLSMANYKIGLDTVVFEVAVHCRDATRSGCDFWV